MCTTSVAERDSVISLYLRRALPHTEITLEEQEILEQYTEDLAVYNQEYPIDLLALFNALKPPEQYQTPNFYQFVRSMREDLRFLCTDQEIETLCDAFLVLCHYPGDGTVRQVQRSEEDTVWEYPEEGKSQLQERFSEIQELISSHRVNSEKFWEIYSRCSIGWDGDSSGYDSAITVPVIDRFCVISRRLQEGGTPQEIGLALRALEMILSEMEVHSGYTGKDHLQSYHCLLPARILDYLDCLVENIPKSFQESVRDDFIKSKRRLDTNRRKALFFHLCDLMDRGWNAQESVEALSEFIGSLESQRELFMTYINGVYCCWSPFQSNPGKVAEFRLLDHLEENEFFFQSPRGEEVVKILIKALTTDNINNYSDRRTGSLMDKTPLSAMIRLSQNFPGFSQFIVDCYVENFESDGDFRFLLYCFDYWPDKDCWCKHRHTFSSLPFTNPGSGWIRPYLSKLSLWLKEFQAEPVLSQILHYIQNSCREPDHIKIELLQELGPGLVDYPDLVSSLIDSYKSWNEEVQRVDIFQKRYSENLEWLQSYLEFTAS